MTTTNWIDAISGHDCNQYQSYQIYNQVSGSTIEIDDEEQIQEGWLCIYLIVIYFNAKILYKARGFKEMKYEVFWIFSNKSAGY